MKTLLVIFMLACAQAQTCCQDYSHVKCVACNFQLSTVESCSVCADCYGCKKIEDVWRYIATLEKDLRAKDQMLEAKDQALEAKDKALEAKDKALEAKDAALEANLKTDYVTKNAATSTYLTSSNAASTYLTQASASNTFSLAGTVEYNIGTFRTNTGTVTMKATSSAICYLTETTTTTNIEVATLQFVMDELRLFATTSSTFSTSQMRDQSVVIYGGYVYAAMDLCPATANYNDGTCSNTCQDSYIEMPTNWKVATYSSSVVAQMASPSGGKEGFGTNVLIYSNGHSYETSAGGRSSSGMLGSSGNSYKANGCARKVLMQRALPLYKKLGKGDCCRSNGANIGGYSGAPHFEFCAGLCLKTTGCIAFSHSTTWNNCGLCSKCDHSTAGNGSRYTSGEFSLPNPGKFTSCKVSQSGGYWTLTGVGASCKARCVEI